MANVPSRYRITEFQSRRSNQQITQWNRNPAGLQTAIDFSGAECDWYRNRFHRHFAQQLIQESLASDLARGRIRSFYAMRQLNDRNDRERCVRVAQFSNQVFDDATRVLSNAFGGNQNRRVQDDAHRQSNPIPAGLAVRDDDL